MAENTPRLSFTCDYEEGAHPAILKRLAETNFLKEPGYGYDEFSLAAKDKIREAGALRTPGSTSLSAARRQTPR